MISVCIATYNGERFISQQLSSILSQLGDDDEVVISDDQSTDRTLEIIAGLNDPRVKVFSHQRYTRHDFPLDCTTHNFQNALQHSSGDMNYMRGLHDPDWSKATVRSENNIKESTTYICPSRGFVMLDYYVNHDKGNLTIKLSSFTLKIINGYDITERQLCFPVNKGDVINIVLTSSISSTNFFNYVINFIPYKVQ